MIPGPSRPRAARTETSQESQDEYGQLELDLDDPDLLAALGDEGDNSLAKANAAKDEQVCKASHR